MINVYETTSVGSVMGSPLDPNGGYFIGPLGRVNKRKLNSRMMYPKGKRVDAPQGYVQESEENELSPEYLYDLNGKHVTTKDLYEWFSPEIGKKPSWNGGKLVSRGYR